jgi:predicted chitinase
VAAFFANVAEETAYLEKPVQDVGVTDPTYKGRGSIQITGQAIYAAADGFLNAGIVANPDKVGTDPVLVWATGLWYWMKHGNPSAAAPQICHDSILQGQFGHTVRIIKGDCGSSDSRGNRYKSYCMTLGITPGNVTCQ